MKKYFLLFGLLLFMKQTASANIIIDLDVKLSIIVVPNVSYPCGALGSCNYPVSYSNSNWMYIRNPAGQYLPFYFDILNSGHIKLKEAYSAIPIPNARLVLPTEICNVYGSTQGFISLRICSEGGGGDLVYLYFTQIGANAISVYLGPNPAGLVLYKMESQKPNSTRYTQAGPIRLSSDEAVTEERSDVETDYIKNAVSPNPFSQLLQVQANADVTEQVDLQLVNPKGQILCRQNYPGGQAEYPLSTEKVPPGIYFLKAQVADRVQIYRVVKFE